MSGGRGKGLSRFWLDDEEMAKKDDDLNAPGHAHKRPHALSLSRAAPASGWQAAAPRPPRKSLILRLIIYVCLMFLALVLVLHVFGSSASSTRYLGDNGARLNEHPGEPHSPPQPPPPASQGAPPKGLNNGFNNIANAKDLSGSSRSYNGLLRFPELASSLQAIGSTDGALPINRNVLFAAASLRSISTLLPLACHMAEQKLNYVHFAFLTNTEIPVSEILKINGIDKKCQVIYHDARPDDPSHSTDMRMARASSRAMFHIATYMHPQALVIDSTAGEESWFLAGVRDQLRSQNIALIELPERPHLRLGWLAQLDASSLAEWNRLTFDIIVHAPSSGSEGMKRLLMSLARADLSSIAVPHLTIELPAIIDKPLADYLNTFNWPRSPRTTSSPSLLTIRRRVSRSKLNPEESSARFLESFWPANPTSNHVLVLSSNVEISPHFFHYMKYALLKYQHGTFAMDSGWEHRLFGLGFARPQTLLDGKTPFVSPASLSEDQSTDVPFLWQGPNSDAMLVLGKMWREMHSFASIYLERAAAAGHTPAFMAKKEISETQPAWLEYLLQMSRLRGYFTLYPSPATSDGVLGAHKDLYHIPEEYQKDLGASGANTEGDTKTSYKATQYAETFDPWSAVDLMTLLPSKGKLDSLNHMPLLALDGKKATAQELADAATEYAKTFRMEVGGCGPGDLDRLPDWTAEDLFCTTKPEAPAGAPAA